MLTYLNYAGATGLAHATPGAREAAIVSVAIVVVWLLLAARS